MTNSPQTHPQTHPRTPTHLVAAMAPEAGRAAGADRGLEPRWRGLLLAALVGLASVGGPSYGAEPAPEAAEARLEALVNDLGAADYDTREAAAKALLAAGYVAKDALAAKLNAADPEVRDRARKLYAEVRLLVVPGAERAEIEAVVAAAKASPGDERRWRTFVHKHGAKTMKLLLELADSGPDKARPDGKPLAGTQVQGRPVAANEGIVDIFSGDEDEDDDDDDTPQRQEEIALTKILGTGLTVTLEGTSGEAVAQEIASMPATSRARGVLLLETAPVSGGLASYALYHAWLALGEPARAFEEGRRLWLAHPSDGLLAELGDLLVAHKLGETVWQNAGTRLLALDDEDEAFELLIFYVLTAQRAGNPSVIKTLLTVMDKDDDRDERMNLAIAAMEHGSFAVVPLLLEGDESNAANLLRQWALQGQKTGAPISDAAWEAQLASLKDEADAYRLAELMSTLDHERQVAAWEHLLAMPPENSARDGEALIRLGDLARLDGQFALSATRIEAGLDVLAASGRPHPRDQAMRRLLPSLKEMGGEGDAAYNAAIQRGRTAMAKRQFPEAITHFKEAQQERPDDLSTTLLLLRAYKYANQVAPLKEARDYLRTAEPESLDDRAALAYLLVDLDELEPAEKHANLLIASVPRSPGVLLILAQIREHQGNFREAIKLMRQAITMGAEDNELYRSLAIGYAKSGDFASAEALLIKYLREEPGEPYGRIMLWVVRRRMGYDDAPAVKTYLSYLKPDPSAWDTQLLRFCAGDLPADALLKAADTATDPDLVAGQHCEAHFYIGQGQLANGDKAAARASFEKVVSFGISMFIEHTWAVIELRLMAASDDGTAPQHTGEPAQP